MFGRGRASQPVEHLRLAEIDTPLDEWAAMRDVYEALAPFDEASQTRIVEAVRRRLGDELSARCHAAAAEDRDAGGF